MSLLVVEGTDGSGKGTQCELIKKYLKEKNKTFAFFHFPMYGHNNFSDIIARFLRGELGSIEDVDPYFVANIYAMDRFMFLPELTKALEENDVVLLDRYVFSNIAYQSAKYPIASKEHQDIRNWISEFEFDFLGLPYPDLNIFYDVPTSVTKQRLEAGRSGSDRDYLNGKQDIHEADFGFQERVRYSYITAMDHAVNCQIINAVCYPVGKPEFVFSPEELFERTKKYLDVIL